MEILKYIINFILLIFLIVWGLPCILAVLILRTKNYLDDYGFNIKNDND